MTFKKVFQKCFLYFIPFPLYEINSIYLFTTKDVDIIFSYSDVVYKSGLGMKDECNDIMMR